MPRLACSSDKSLVKDKMIAHLFLVNHYTDNINGFVRLKKLINAAAIKRKQNHFHKVKFILQLNNSKYRNI